MIYYYIQILLGMAGVVLCAVRYRSRPLLLLAGTGLFLLKIGHIAVNHFHQAHWLETVGSSQLLSPSLVVCFGLVVLLGGRKPTPLEHIEDKLTQKEHE